MFKQGLLLKKHKRQKRLRKLKQKSKLTASAPTKVQACTIRELAAGKPTFNVQINNNVSNIGGQQAQQNSLMDSAQLFAVVSAAA